MASAVFSQPYMKKLLPLIILLFELSVFAQQPDRWKGLVLDESPPQQVLDLLGMPKTDKLDLLAIIQYKWMTKDIRKKTWRVFHYENVEGFKDVKLGFDKNSKLVFISLEPKKISAQAFISSYDDLEFRFANEVMSPGDFKNSRDNTDKPRRMDVVYVLVSLTDKAFVFGGVGNAVGSVMSEMFGGMNRQSGRSTPGDMYVIQLVSRTLENKDGSDLLK